MGYELDVLETPAIIRKAAHRVTLLLLHWAACFLRPVAARSY